MNTLADWARFENCSGEQLERDLTQLARVLNRSPDKGIRLFAFWEMVRLHKQRTPACVLDAKASVLQ